MATIYFCDCTRCLPDLTFINSKSRIYRLNPYTKSLICENQITIISPRDFFDCERSRKFENDHSGYYSIGICRNCGFRMMMDLNKHIPLASFTFYLWMGDITREDSICSNKHYDYCRQSPLEYCKIEHLKYFKEIKNEIVGKLLDAKKRKVIQTLEYLLNVEEFVACEEECMKMLRFNKHDADVYFYIGASQIHTGKVKSGYEFLKKAVELFPEKAEYYGHLAEAEYLMYKPSFYIEAIDVCNRGLAQNPEDSKCLAMRSIITISYCNYFPEDKTLKYNVIADLEKSAKKTGNLFHWELLSREKLKIGDFQGCIYAATFVLDNFQHDFHHKSYLTIDCEFTKARIARAYYEINKTYPENTDCEMVEKEAEKSNWAKLHIGNYSKKHKIKAGELYQWDLW